MGFTQSEAKTNYLKAKEGKFFLNNEPQEFPFEGKIVNLSFKDLEYQGETKRMLSIKFIDDEGVHYQLDLNVESNNYSSLVSFLSSHLIDLKQPVILHPQSDAIEGKQFKRNSILVSQNANGGKVFAKAYFTKATPNGIPAWKSVKVGSKVVTDKTDYLEFLENHVNTVLCNKITPNAPQLKEVKPDVFDVEKENEEVVEKMPWD